MFNGSMAYKSGMSIGRRYYQGVCIRALQTDKVSSWFPGKPISSGGCFLWKALMIDLSAFRLYQPGIVGLNVPMCLGKPSVYSESHPPPRPVKNEHIPLKVCWYITKTKTTLTLLIQRYNTGIVYVWMCLYHTYRTHTHIYVYIICNYF